MGRGWAGERGVFVGRMVSAIDMTLTDKRIRRLKKTIVRRIGHSLLSTKIGRR